MSSQNNLILSLAKILKQSPREQVRRYVGRYVHKAMANSTELSVTNVLFESVYNKLSNAIILARSNISKKIYEYRF